MVCRVFGGFPNLKVQTMRKSFGFFVNVNLKSVIMLFDELNATRIHSDVVSHVAMNSNGGETACGLMFFNLVRDFGITAHNVGLVDSAAVTMFLAANYRIASPLASFLIHPPTRIFHKDSKHSRSDLIEITEGMKIEVQQTVQIIVDRTNLTRSRANAMMGKGTVFDAKTAKNAGIVHEISEYQPDPGGSIKFIES